MKLILFAENILLRSSAFSVSMQLCLVLVY
jgi:hypothetical protein